MGCRLNYLYLDGHISLLLFLNQILYPIALQSSYLGYHHFFVLIWHLNDVFLLFCIPKTLDNILLLVLLGKECRMLPLYFAYEYWDFSTKRDLPELKPRSWKLDREITASERSERSYHSLLNLPEMFLHKTLSTTAQSFWT